MTGKMPVGYYRLFVSDSNLHNVLVETNRYGEQYVESHQDHVDNHPRARAHDFIRWWFTRSELLRLIVLIITIGIITPPCMNHYWSTSWPFHTQHFSKLLSRDCFLPSSSSSIWLITLSKLLQASLDATNYSSSVLSWIPLSGASSECLYHRSNFVSMRQWSATRADFPSSNTALKSQRNGEWKHGLLQTENWDTSTTGSFTVGKKMNKGVSFLWRE